MKFRCRYVGSDDEAIPVHSVDPSSAAEEFVRTVDEDTLPASAVQVDVTAPDGAVTRWHVWVHKVVYHTERVS